MAKISVGAKNLITDLEGIKVGNVTDHELNSGVTALICDVPMTASVHVMGGAPGTRETDLLSPENVVEQVDGLVLSGGSAFGLDAASGAQAAMREMGRGFEIGPHQIPIIPTAILFDLINGGDKNWGKYPPYRDMGYDAVMAASTEFDLGNYGAGTGALCANVKGGLGSASSVVELDDGRKITIAALVAANPLGTPLIGDSKHFWAAPFEQGDEFGGFGMPHPYPHCADQLRIKHREEQTSGANTTIAIIATDAKLNKSQTKRLAVAAHDGFARAIWPSHTPLDGDLIFGLATGKSEVEPNIDQYIDLGAIASATMSRAIARGIYHTQKQEKDILPSFSDV